MDGKEILGFAIDRFFLLTHKRTYAHANDMPTWITGANRLSRQTC